MTMVVLTIWNVADEDDLATLLPGPLHCDVAGGAVRREARFVV